MSFAEKIRAKAKTPEEIVKYLQLCIGDAIPISENEKFVHVEDAEKVHAEAVADFKQKLQQLFRDFDKWFDDLLINHNKVDEGMKLRSKIMELLEELDKVE